MKNIRPKPKLLSISLLILSIILTSISSASTALAACGSTTNVATESELNVAIADFNSQSSACSYTITLTSDINLTASTTEINNATANVDLLIDGAGFTVDGQDTSGVRPFEIAANTVVELQNLTITGSNLSPGAHGGGIRNNAGTLTLTAVNLTNNYNPYIFGSGLYNAGGTVTFQNNSVISNNNAEFGGGIYNANGGTVNIYNSAITGNTSLSGGGIYHSSGTLNVAGSTFSGNDGSGGAAAIESDNGVITIDSSQFTGVRHLSGPPVTFNGTMTIRNSTITGYSNINNGTLDVSGTLTVINTTISNNSATTGGGIASFGIGTITVINSTISGNTGSVNEAGIHTFGGTVNIINSTIAGNSRGIDVYDSSGVVNISNSLIVNSIGANCAINGTVNASGANFADDDTCDGLTNDSAAGTNLGSLQDNGGPTFTHALLDGNPAINSGVNALAVDENGDPLTTDQRGDGFPRIVGNVVDVGAFESAFISNEPPTAAAGGPYTVAEGDSVQLDGTGSSDADQDPSTLTYAWDFDGDGQYDDASGSTPTFSAAALDGPDSVTIGLQVTDDGDLTATDSAEITVNNANPTINAVTNDGPIDQGNSATITVTASDPAGANDPLSYEFDCDNDNAYEIGPQSGNSAACFFGDSGSFTVNVRVSDDDGGQATDSTTVTVEAVDTTAPVITPNISGTLGNNGWYISDVEVSWTVTDDESAISSTNGCDTSTINSDTAGVTLTCEATSDGGTASESVTIQRDATAPTASASVSPAANANGWYNTDVTVSFSGSDDTSGIAGCDADVILSGDGADQSAGGVCTDNAGNVSATATVAAINIDKTAPVVNVTGVEDGATYSLGSVPSAGCDTQDALSGVATEASLSLSGGNSSGVGSFTATCDGASDNAGNTSSASVTYSVVYDFGSFTDPIDPQAVNEVKAGRAIPVKFSLNGDQGLNIFADGYPASQEVACEGSAPVNEVEEVDTPGNSGLSYDPETDTYTYVWKTKKGWKGTCRQLIVKLNDGTDHTALFRFK